MNAREGAPARGWSGETGRRRAARHLLLAGLAALALGCETSSAAPAVPASRKLDVPYEPTPPQVVDAMLRVAEVRAGDVVYDLGCGDGRIVIEAAKLGARGVGVDIDPQRVREARENARTAGVEGRVEFREADLFETDVSAASVVMLYLWPEVNLRLRPRLLAQLRPGSRVVSHAHDMGTWTPQRTVTVNGKKVHLWIVP